MNKTGFRCFIFLSVLLWMVVSFIERHYFGNLPEEPAAFVENRLELEATAIDFVLAMIIANIALFLIELGDGYFFHRAHRIKRGVRLYRTCRAGSRRIACLRFTHDFRRFYYRFELFFPYKG